MYYKIINENNKNKKILLIFDRLTKKYCSNFKWHCKKMHQVFRE